MYILRWFSVVVVGGGLVSCKIEYRDFLILQKFLNLDIPYSPKRPRNQTSPNSDNLGESDGCLNPSPLARGS